MKISRLFHWLYAFLMLMPVFAVVAACVTTFWNDTIEMPYQEVNVTNQLQTNEVNSVDDLVVGNIYDFNLTGNNYVDSNISYFRATQYFNFYISSRKMDMDAKPNGVAYLTFKESSAHYLLDSYVLTSAGKNEMYNTKFQFVYYGDFNDVYISQVSAATWIPQGTYEIVEHNTSDMDVFYYAIDELQDNVLFSWANNSFLYAPFHYIGSLFNVDNDSVVYTLLSYWSSISIIYLVFDLVMYVPLLAHRWIDKGMIE